MSNEITTHDLQMAQHLDAKAAQIDRVIEVLKWADSRSDANERAKFITMAQRQLAKVDRIDRDEIELRAHEMGGKSADFMDALEERRNDLRKEARLTRRDGYPPKWESPMTRRLKQRIVDSPYTYAKSRRKQK